MQNNIREGVENLIKQNQWHQAQTLLDGEPNNADLADLRSKVEKHIAETRAYIRKYIQDHSKNYTPISIEEKLRFAGYEETDIREAFAALGIENAPQIVYGEKGGNSYATVSANPLGFFLFFPVIPFVIWLALMANYRVGEFIVFIIIAVFLLGTLLPRLIKEEYPATAKGMMYGFRTLLVVFVVLPIVGIGVLWGICLLTGM